MINLIKSYKFAIKYVVGFGTKKIPQNKYKLSIEEYLGLDNNKIPMRIYYSYKSTKKTIIIFLGASPDGEKHVAVNLLAQNLSSLGYNVFIPRIPPLMSLNISNENVDWMRHIYNLIHKRKDVDSDNIIGFGISYGGGMLLKASLESEFLRNPLKSIYLYGAGCNAETILKFITKGEFEVQGNIVKIKPHEWGLTVFFHHFIDEIDFGFSNEKIKEVLQLRVENKKDESNKKIEELNNQEQNIAKSITTGKINQEVQKLVDQILKNKFNYIEDLSCKKICTDVKTKAFILHGANDNMIPYTESIQLDELLPNSELLISYLFEHKGIASKRNILFKIKELLRLIQFLAKFYRYNES